MINHWCGKLAILLKFAFSDLLIDKIDFYNEKHKLYYNDATIFDFGFI